ncbi:protein phosphatase 2C domain-containing protein [Dactylosporangium sp. CA-139066]|uniref:protein phosphatase 2C domain-containing protein n=1 Tax=Dactylosporangium sp. CA-139066 TaxID=3239930 RepID=UPI003D8A7051
MDLAFATEAAPGRVNEDHLVLAPGFAIVLDGVTQLPGLDTGCLHSPGWLVRALGAELTAALSADGAVALDAALAGAIETVARRHADTCDLANPDSPATTVAIVRERPGFLDYLVLCDSTFAYADAHGVTAITDDRTERLAAYDRVSVARVRNRPGGYWVASTRPEAAAEALTGSVPADSVYRLMICTDGVSRLVDCFGLGWPDVFGLAERAGPRAVIRAVRDHETAHPERLRRAGRRVKQHDDATLVVGR